MLLSLTFVVPLLVLCCLQTRTMLTNETSSERNLKRRLLEGKAKKEVSDHEGSSVGESWGLEDARRARGVWARLQGAMSNCMEMSSMVGGDGDGKGESQEELLKR